MLAQVYLALKGQLVHLDLLGLKVILGHKGHPALLVLIQEAVVALFVLMDLLRAHLLLIILEDR
jgi:hypothetical protein